MSSIRGTNSPPPEDKVMGEQGQSKSIPDEQQRGDQFGVKKAENIESGQVGESGLGQAAESAAKTAEAYQNRTNVG